MCAQGQGAANVHPEVLSHLCAAWRLRVRQSPFATFITYRVKQPR